MTRAKTKIIISLLAVTMAFSLTACTNQDDIDNAVTPLSEQITQIDGYIDTLVSKVEMLENSLTGINTAIETLEENSATKTALTETKTALESEIKAIKEDIKALQTKDTELDGKITALQTACDTLKTEIIASIATLQGKIDGLETSVDTLNTTVTALQTQVQENTDKIEELENRINCLEGKHETETISYVYTWSETVPTSTKNYTCLHCGKALEETVSPSVWSVGDKVTYVAKDGNSYVSTVGEVTDGKAVLVSDNDYSVKGKYGETALLALLEPVGARFPKIPETIYTTIIEPWLLDVLVYQGGINSVAYIESHSAYRYLYKSDADFIGSSYISNASSNTKTWIYRYVWDVEFTTVE